MTDYDIMSKIMDVTAEIRQRRDQSEILSDEKATYRRVSKDLDRVYKSMNCALNVRSSVKVKR